MKRLYFKDLKKCPFCGKKPKKYENPQYIGCRNPICIIGVSAAATMDWELWNRRFR